MTHRESPGQRVRRAARLRFAPGIEPLFRNTLRKRIRPARTVTFLIFGAAFGLVPFCQEFLFGYPPEAADFLWCMDVLLVFPVALAAAGLTFFPSPPLLRQGVQTAAVLALLAASITLRHIALRSGADYPAQMIGVVLLGIAVFGGFSWWRIAPLTLVVATVAAALEFAYATPQSHPVVQAYSLLLMALIALLGSYNVELLMRLAWWDFTQLRKAQGAHRESEQRFKAFMDHTPSIAWIKDHEGRYVYRNKAHSDRYGEPDHDWTGLHDRDLFPGEEARVYADTDARVVSSGGPVEFDTLNHDRFGRAAEWWVQKFPIRDETGRTLVGGIGIDIGERNRLQRELRGSEARFQAFLDHSPGLAWMKDEDGRYLYTSTSFRAAIGVDEVQGRTDFDFLPEAFAQRMRDVQLAVLSSNQMQIVEGPAPGLQAAGRYWMLVIFPFIDSAGRRFTGGIATDITGRKLAEDAMRLQSLSDDLTGLYNRRGLNLLAAQELRHARRQKLGCAVLYVDIDGLKQINDHHGHAGGDQAIITVAEALRVAARSSDIVARVGGDEFVVFALGAEAPEALRQRMQEQIAAGVAAQGLGFEVSASIGVVEFDPARLASVEDVLAAADTQMYDSKRTRRGGAAPGA